MCKRFRGRFTDKIGGDDETRTHYLDNANVALYQMSYAPKRKTLPKSNHRRAVSSRAFFLYAVLP